ncbi:MAG: hypothetical protein GY863_11295 [bacterium]|nr:hypothetical protein [bacterium]
MESNNSKEQKPFIGIHFKCCNVYNRIYMNNKKDAFVGWCPKCAKRVHIGISPDGVDSKYFEVK